MSVFVFSDTHFTKKFDEKRYNKLVELITKADKVIIDGDLWEGLSISFDDFYNSEWRKLFPLLKSKNTIYVYGNHDAKELNDNRIYEFCDIAVNSYTHQTPRQTFHFTHGSSFLYPYEKEENLDWKRARSFRKKADVFVANIIQKFIYTLFTSDALPKKFNNMTKAQRESIAPIDHLLVCGHSHTPAYNKDLNFMDLGFFNYGWANYLWIKDDGKYEFKKERFGKSSINLSPKLINWLFLHTKTTLPE